MNKIKISSKRLSLAAVITFLMTLIPSCFESTQRFSVDKAELILGFPFDFYTIKYTAVRTFAVHFNVLGLLANVAAVYIALTLCVWVWGRLKGGSMNE